MSYLCYLCLFTHSGVQHILCCASVLFFSSCIPYVASFSRLFFNSPFGFLERKFSIFYLCNAA
jgi:hypothetical protein